MNDLAGWSKVIEESGKSERRKDKQFNDELSKPNAVLTIDDCKFGYWKTAEGILRIRKMKNGYDRYSCIQITNKEFKVLEEVYYK